MVKHDSTIAYLTDWMKEDQSNRREFALFFTSKKLVISLFDNTFIVHKEIPSIPGITEEFLKYTAEVAVFELNKKIETYKNQERSHGD